MELAWQAEELLRWAAADDAPAVFLNAGSAEERARCREAWQAWWKERGPRLDLDARLRDPRRPGLVLVRTGPEERPPGWGILLCGSDGRTRWSVGGLRDVRHSSARLQGNRLITIDDPDFGHRALRDDDLIAPRLVERDLTGKVIKETALPPGYLLHEYEILANGNVFTANSADGGEFEPDGTPVHQPPFLAFASYRYPRRQPNGRILAVRALPLKGDLGTGPKEIAEFDPLGRRLLKVGFLEQDLIGGPSGAFHLQSLPDGHYVLCGRALAEGDGRGFGLLEFDADGRLLWKEVGSQPILGAKRLPNGHLLLDRGPWQLEIDRAGRRVGEVLLGGLSRRTCFGLVRLGFDAPLPADLDLALSPAHRLRVFRQSEKWARRFAIEEVIPLGPKAVDAAAELV
jgi:hypothetical protein